MAEVGNLSVRLSLDNAQFERSIASMNRTLTAMGQELRGLQNRGSEWGNSLEGLRTKQEAYSRMLEAQQTKVQRLAELYETAKTEQGEYSNEAQNLAVQLNRANAEMTRTETELNAINAELRRQEEALVDTRTGWQRFQESAEAAGARMQEVGKKMASVGKDLTMKVTAPIVAMGAAIVKIGADFEQQMSRVGAISGATGEELNQLKETAMELGASTSKSASEVAIGMENMAAMGFTVNEIMGAMPGVIAAAEASGADMAQTADVVATALNIWGLEATEASRVSDVLAEVANRSAADINDMQYALKYAGSPAAALGVSLEELSASIGIMSDAGLEGSQAGTSMRAGLLALLKPSEKNSKMMDALGISVTDLEGNFVGMSGLIENITEATEGMTDTNKLATLAALVGTEASSGFLTLIEAGPEKIDLFSKSLENSAGASKKAADLMKDNLKGSVEELGGALETLAIQMYTLLEPAIRKVVEFVQILVEKFSSISPSTKIVILVMAAIAAAIGPLLVVLGILISSIGTVVGAFALISGPVALIVAGVGLLVGALVLAYTQSETFRDKVNQVFTAIKDVAVDVFKVVYSFITDQLTALKTFWDENGAQILEAVTNVFNGIMAVINFIMPAIKFIIEVVWAAIKDIISGALNVIMGVVKIFSGLFTGDFGKMWEGVKQLFFGAIDLIIGWMSLTFFGGLKTLFMNFTKAVVGFVKGMWDDIALFFTNFITSITTKVTGFSATVTNLISKMAASVINFFKGIFTGGSGAITNLVNSVKSLITGMKDAVISTVTTLKDLFVGVFTGLWTNITTVVGSIKDTIINTFKGIDLVQIGKDIIMGLINGIGSMASYVWDEVTSIVDGIKDAITGKSGLDTHSPSRVTEEYGVNTGQGLVIGMDNMISKVAQASGRLAGAVKGAQVSLSSGANASASSSSSVTHAPVKNDYYITIDAKNVREFNDVVQLMQGIPQASRSV